VSGVDAPVVRLIKRANGIEEILGQQPIRGGRLYLKIEARAQAFNFYCALQPGEWNPVAEAVDGRILSTPVAGGFLGTYIGMLASSNGLRSGNSVDFDWFDYIGLDEA
jgi:alpha-N-arabinofuranosidase